MGSEKYLIINVKTKLKYMSFLCREKINFLNEEIKQKDAQLVTFGRALHELEEASK